MWASMAVRARLQLISRLRVGLLMDFSIRRIWGAGYRGRARRVRRKDRLGSRRDRRVGVVGLVSTGEVGGLRQRNEGINVTPAPGPTHMSNANRHDSNVSVTYVGTTY